MKENSEDFTVSFIRAIAATGQPVTSSPASNQEPPPIDRTSAKPPPQTPPSRRERS